MKLTSSNFQLAGPAGNIQAVLDLPDKITHKNYFAVNCHPHSLHGGSMTNKVIHTVSRSIAGLGIPSCRFNFRGVGQSEGEYDEGIGEQQDLASVIEWMQNQYPGAKLLLSGFSFGSYVAAMAASTCNPALLLSIAPPIARFDFAQFDYPECPWGIIIGDADELVDYTTVKSWVAAFAKSPQMITLAGASHFFHGRLVELREHVESVVQQLVLAQRN